MSKLPMFTMDSMMVPTCKVTQSTDTLKSVNSSGYSAMTFLIAPILNHQP